MTRLCFPLLALLHIALANARFIGRESIQPRSPAPEPAHLQPVCRAATSWASPWDLHGFTPYNVQASSDAIYEDASPIDSAHTERRFIEGFQQITGAGGFTLQKRAGDAIDYTKRKCSTMS